MVAEKIIFFGSYLPLRSSQMVSNQRAFAHPVGSEVRVSQLCRENRILDYHPLMKKGGIFILFLIVLSSKRFSSMSNHSPFIFIFYFKNSV